MEDPNYFLKQAIIEFIVFAVAVAIVVSIMLKLAI